MTIKRRVFGSDTKPALELCNARPADAKAISELLVGQMMEHHVKANHETLRRLVRQFLLNKRRGFAIIGRSGGEVVGVAYVPMIISMEHGGPLGWLEELYVTPACREQGIGTWLLKAVIAQARKLRLVALELEVDIEHRRAENLYGRHGFKRLERTRWVKRLRHG